MALVSPPNWLQAGTYTAQADRVNQQAIFGSTGVIGATSLAVTAQASPNMTVNIAAGWGAIVSSSALQGVYGIYNDATVVQAISAADPTNPRIDLIVATVNDAAISGSLNNVVFTTVTGTPAVSPVAPAVPSNSLLLAQIAVAAATTTITTANITDKRVPVQNSLTNASYYTSNGTYTVATPTTAYQNIYAANGAGLTLAANTAYEIEGYLIYRFTIGATSLNSTFQLTYSSSQTSANFLVFTGANTSSFATAASTTFNYTAGLINSGVAVTNAATNVTNYVTVYYKGIFKTLGSGILNPQVAFSSVTNLSAVQSTNNSWIKATPIAGSSFTSVGAWS